MIASLLGTSDRRRDESTSRVMRGRVAMLMLDMVNADSEIKGRQTGGRCQEWSGYTIAFNSLRGCLSSSFDYR